jgi:hypothetical protein
LSLSIWKLDIFRKILGQCVGINPWQFELQTLHKSFDKFYCVVPNKESEFFKGVISWAGIYGASNGFDIYPQVRDIIKNENIKNFDGTDFNLEIKL